MQQNIDGHLEKLLKADAAMFTQATELSSKLEALDGCGLQELAASALLIYEKSGRTSRHELAEVRDWASKSGLPNL